MGVTEITTVASSVAQHRSTKRPFHALAAYAASACAFGAPGGA